jgi:hypothetical protein
MPRLGIAVTYACMIKAALAFYGVFWDTNLTLFITPSRVKMRGEGMDQMGLSSGQPHRPIAFEFLDI